MNNIKKKSVKKPNLIKYMGFFLFVLSFVFLLIGTETIKNIVPLIAVIGLMLLIIGQLDESFSWENE